MSEPFIPDGPPELVGGNLWTPQAKRAFLRADVAAAMLSGTDQRVDRLLQEYKRLAPWSQTQGAYEIPQDLVLIRSPNRITLAYTPDWLAYTFLPPTEIEFEIDTTKRCTRCDREWVEELDKYWGKVPWLAELCADCRRKA